MSDHALAVAAFVFTGLMFLLAVVGLGVALLTVPNHPDRAKYAKACFAAAALLSLLAAFFFTVSTSWSLLVRIILDFVWLSATVIGLGAGFRFANRSSLAELGIPSSAFVSEPLWPRNKNLLALIVFGILAVTALLNAIREPDIAGRWIWAQTLIIWGAPWKWVLPSMIVTTIPAAIAGFLIARRMRPTASQASLRGLQWSAEGTVRKPNDTERALMAERDSLKSQLTALADSQNQKHRGQLITSWRKMLNTARREYDNALRGEDSFKEVLEAQEDYLSLEPLLSEETRQALIDDDLQHNKVLTIVDRGQRPPLLDPADHLVLKIAGDITRKEKEWHLI